MIAQTMFGLEEILVNELTALGAKEIETKQGGGLCGRFEHDV
jgi:23S rRNA G2445 N2-methylase RlmL